MRFSYLALGFATFVTSCMAANTASYNAFAAACQHNGINVGALNTGYRYAMYDYSPSRGGATDCVAGFHHVRLVVGTIIPVSGGRDFEATSWDLIITQNGADWNTEPWKADYHLNDNNQWVPTRSGHTYAIASSGQVRTGYSDSVINGYANQYISTYGHTYSLSSNNCWTFAYYMSGGITQNIVQRDLEGGVLDPTQMDFSNC